MNLYHYRNGFLFASSAAAAAALVKALTNAGSANAWIPSKSIFVSRAVRSEEMMYYLLKQPRLGFALSSSSSSSSSNWPRATTTATRNLRHFSTAVPLAEDELIAAISDTSFVKDVRTDHISVEKNDQNHQNMQKNSPEREDKTIAEGFVVARYNGLIAVKISEEFTADPDNSANTITLSTDGMPLPPAAAAATKVVKLEVGDYQGKKVVFGNGDVGYVVVHRAPLVYVCRDEKASTSSQPSNDHISNDDNDDESSHNQAKIKDSVAILDIPCNLPEPITMDCFGRPIHTNALKDTNTLETFVTQPQYRREIFSPIPQVKDIALINNPLLTGITMIDALAPIGRGQNMLLIGHDLSYMRGMVLDILQTQLRTNNHNNNNNNNSANRPVQCIYAATQESAETVLQRFQSVGIDGQVQLIAPTTQRPDSEGLSVEDATVASRSAEAVFIAATACAIGESYAINEGKDALVIVDTIDAHKTLWDWTTKIMVKQFGVDAVVAGDLSGAASSEMRAFFSSLIQRSAQYKSSTTQLQDIQDNHNEDSNIDQRNNNIKNRGGSVTLLLLSTIPPPVDDLDSHGTNTATTLYTAEDFAHAPIKIRNRIELLLQKDIPLTASTLRKINIPIPSVAEGKRRLALQHVDDLISMSDGQIWLHDFVTKQNMLRIDPQRSVTRIGIGADTPSRADAPALRQIATEGLRLELSQATDSSMTIMSKTSVADSATIKQHRRQRALQLALHQPPLSSSWTGTTGGRTLSESCIALLAARNGHFDDVLVDETNEQQDEQISRLLQQLLLFVRTNVPNIMETIDLTFDLTPNDRNKLDETIQLFFSTQKTTINE